MFFFNCISYNQIGYQIVFIFFLIGLTVPCAFNHRKLNLTFCLGWIAMSTLSRNCMCRRSSIGWQWWLQWSKVTQMSEGGSTYWDFTTIFRFVHFYVTVVLKQPWYDPLKAQITHSTFLLRISYIAFLWRDNHDRRLKLLLHRVSMGVSSNLYKFSA